VKVRSERSEVDDGAFEVTRVWITEAGRTCAGGAGITSLSIAAGAAGLGVHEFRMQHHSALLWIRDRAAVCGYCRNAVLGVAISPGAFMCLSTAAVLSLRRKLLFAALVTRRCRGGRSVAGKKISSAPPRGSFPVAIHRSLQMLDVINNLFGS
jgi:hypothetical protein